MTPKERLLKMIAGEIEACTGCELANECGHVVPGEGNPNAEIVFCGEAPGSTEAEQGRPFVGRAGKLLDNMIKSMGYAREDVYILNTVKCRPPGNRKPDPEEMKACADYLDMQLQVIDPFIIVALGATAADRLLPDTIGQNLSSRRGKIHKIKLDQSEYNVVCSYHPAFLLRNPPAKQDACADLKLVKDTLNCI